MPASFCAKLWQNTEAQKKMLETTVREQLVHFDISFSFSKYLTVNTNNIVMKIVVAMRDADDHIQH